jgi:UDP-N-acetylglucosamine--N-acetylmuramyl-(pentapeptide) pyrophosphoryl-undecaprenol N-acetylglucosamine transferase
MGSYASVGPVLAAHNLGIPVVLHEANAVPGRAISFLCRFADTVAVSFESTTAHIRHAGIVVTGFPLRPFVSAGPGGAGKDSKFFDVLVMGGSQGAHRLNEIVPLALCQLHAKGLKVRVTHLTGRNDEAAVQSAYEQAGIPHQVCDFLENINEAYGSADLAITRAGAATCAELAAFRLPALLVPLPSARRDHQTANARAMAEGGGVDLVPEKDLTVEWLAGYVENCMRDPEKLDRMKAVLQNRVIADAAERLADLVEGLKHADL